jgi:alanyl-tRNA synthetase
MVKKAENSENKVVWTREKLIKAYLDFFKKNNHKIISNKPLIPENDPTVLFTTAGMHPLVPYLLGQPHPLGKRLCSVQRCIRTGDIDEVGNETHNTFFEMLGNWSLGDYFKEEAIKISYEFLTKVLNIKHEKLSVSCFKGENKIPKDEEAAKIWKKLGIKKISFLGKEDNFWGPAGKTGPCGPDTEMFVNGFEIWNDVFMQYNKTASGNYEELKQKNVDTGMGVERTLAVLNGLNDNYQTEIFLPIIKQIENLSKKSYENKEKETKKAMRIIADHIKASVFILAEGIEPGNVEQGYVLRRLIRRAIRYGKSIGINHNFTKELSKIVIKIYEKDYPGLKQKESFIFEEIEREENKFRETLEKGINLLNKIIEELKKENKKTISGEKAFLLYQSYGFPVELTQEIASEKGFEVDMIGYEEEQAKHKELSQTASAGRFKSGLADAKEKTIKLHTAAHLLMAALKQVLKREVEQKGSNITEERLRLDFSYPEKLTAAQLKEVEKIVNENIKKGFLVKREERSLEDAKKSRAAGVFEHKYGEKVSVYTVCDVKNHNNYVSKEICTGPHVQNTSELGKFKITKQESVSSGVRRIKAVLE